jgi:hypothetical protein
MNALIGVPRDDRHADYESAPDDPYTFEINQSFRTPIGVRTPRRTTCTAQTGRTHSRCDERARELKETVGLTKDDRTKSIKGAKNGDHRSH